MVEPVRVGNPFDKPAYARNVWDMQVFDGRIYLGHGNSANSPPSPNAGPVDIVAYDPAAGTFVVGGRVDDEQIDLFRVLDGRLYIPGQDPRESFEWGNFYRLENGSWVKHRTIPNALHTFDLAYHQGLLFTANGTELDPASGRKTIQMSADLGRTWEVALPEVGRTYDLFVFNGMLYAVFAEYPVPGEAQENLLYRFDGARFVDAGVPVIRMLPGTDPHFADSVRIERATEFQGQLLYIGATIANVNQWEPVSLYVAPALDQSRRVVLSLAGASAGVVKPYDILVRSGTVYLLVAARQADGTYINAVFASQNLSSWTELFRFHAATFARSFEEVNGDFFFGLGTNTDAPSDAAGDILRVNRADYAR